MGQPGRHIKQRLPVYFLLAVLLFVQAVKLLHSHDDVMVQHRFLQAWQQLTMGCSPEGGIDVAYLQGGHHCSICDYDLSKDVTPGTVPVISAIISWRYINYTLFSSPYYAGIHTVHANKGPPAGRS